MSSLGGGGTCQVAKLSEVPSRQGSSKSRSCVSPRGALLLHDEAENLQQPSLGSALGPALRSVLGLGSESGFGTGREGGGGRVQHFS